MLCSSAATTCYCCPFKLIRFRMTPFEFITLYSSVCDLLLMKTTPDAVFIRSFYLVSCRRDGRRWPASCLLISCRVMSCIRRGRRRKRWTMVVAAEAVVMILSGRRRRRRRMLCGDLVSWCSSRTNIVVSLPVSSSSSSIVI